MFRALAIAVLAALGLGVFAQSASAMGIPLPMGYSVGHQGSGQDDILWPNEPNDGDDGNPATFYSSASFPTSANTRGTYYVAYLASAPAVVNQVQLTARAGNIAFPKAYQIYITNSNNSAWNYVGQYDNQPNASGQVAIGIPAASTYGVMIKPITLASYQGAYYFQLAELALSNLPVTEAVYGNVDSIANNIVVGWTFATQHSTTPLLVDFYVDGPVGQGRLGWSTYATALRVDVNKAYSNVGNHGFSSVIPEDFRDGKTHSLYAYGVDPISKSLTLLSGSGKTFSAASDDPQYIVINAFNPANGLNNSQNSFEGEAAWTCNASWLSQIQSLVGIISTPNRRLAFGDDIEVMQMTPAQISACMQVYFAASESMNFPYFVHINTEYNWKNTAESNWASSGGFWNWFDPTQLGYSVANQNNVEWSSWTTPLQTSYLWWGPSPSVLNPKMRDNSPAFRAFLSSNLKLMASLLSQWQTHLLSIGKPYLFAGIDVGWENGIEDYQAEQGFSPSFNMGYGALLQMGYSQNSPPSDINATLQAVVKDFMDFNSAQFNQNGVPRSKIYTHATSAEMLTPQTTVKRAPLQTAVSPFSRPGVSLYPGSYVLSGISAWASQSSDGWAVTEAPPSGDYLNYINLPNLKLLSLYSWGANIDAVTNWGPPMVEVPNASVIAAIKAMFASGAGPQTAVNTPVAPQTTGMITGINTISGMINIQGWACVPNAPGLQVNLIAYRGSTPEGGGIMIGGGTANLPLPNPTAVSACGGNQNAGFSIALAPGITAFAGQPVLVEGAVYNGGQNTFLINSAAYAIP